MSFERMKKFWRDNWVSVVIVIGVIALFLWFLAWVNGTPTEKDLQNRATKGDTFGILNTLFSGLAFAGLIIAISLQSRELSLQRQELEITRKEFEGQTDEFKKQSDLLKQQIFDNRFVQLISLLNEKRKSVPDELFSHFLSDAFFSKPPHMSLENAVVQSIQKNMFALEKYLTFLEYLANLTQSQEEYIKLVQAQITNHEVVTIVLYGSLWEPCTTITLKLRLHEYFKEFTTFTQKGELNLYEIALDEGLLDYLLQSKKSV